MKPYDGYPSIRLEGDQERALALIPEGKALLYRAQSLLANTEATTSSLSLSVDKDSYIYALTSNGQNQIFISVAPTIPDEVTEPEELSAADGWVTPNFYSGVVLGGRLAQRTVQGQTFSVLETFAPTPNCQFYHGLPSGRQTPARLAIQPWVGHPEIENRGGERFSQHARLKASMYSGTMKKVAQVVGGIGRIRKNMFQDPRQPWTHDSQVPKYVKEVENRGVQVRYDYKFYRTHGIYRGGDGNMWLVEVSLNRGVCVRLLPQFPNSHFDSYRIAALNRSDRAMHRALEELGCLPTGEAFPAGAVFDELLDTGEIVQILEPGGLTEFYNCQPYGGAIGMGWAFNERGNEAHNTGWRYVGEDLHQTGFHYQLNINIGSRNLSWRPGHGQIVSGNASLVEQSRGGLWGRGKYGRYLPFKVYDPSLGGLRSHDAHPKAGFLAPFCDTTVWAAFQNDELKVVKFFMDPEAGVVDETDDETEGVACLIGGQWTITTRRGYRGFPRMMYTNDYDDRAVLEETVSETVITSTDLGFDPCRWTDELANIQYQTLWRDKVFRHEIRTHMYGGEHLIGVVAIPAHSREAYYYVHGRSFGYDQGSYSMGYQYLRDPNHYHGFRYLYWHGAGVQVVPDYCDRETCGGTHEDRRIICERYIDGPCREYADSGGWLDICAPVLGVCSNTVPPRPTASSSFDNGRNTSTKAYLRSPGHNGPIVLDIGYGQVENRWNMPSPDPDSGTVQNIYAQHSAIGQDCLVFYKDLAGWGDQDYRGYTPEVIRLNENVAFVGVNIP